MNWWCIKSGRDAFEHILCGASMVQLGTILHQEGPAAFAASQKNLKLSWKKKVMKPRRLPWQIEIYRLIKTKEQGHIVLTLLGFATSYS